MSTQMVDVEGPLRDWLISMLPSTRVFLGDAQRSKTPIDTWLIPVRIGGGLDLTATPFDNPLMSFHCYGRTRKLASGLSVQVFNLLRVDGVDYPQIRLPALTILTSRPTLALWQPDQEGSVDIPRYIVDATMYVRAN